MSTIAEKEPSFKNFLDLPQVLRIMINDEMREDDRCRFSGASTLCNFEAKLSKKYIEFIKFEYYSDDKIQISDRPDENGTSFYLEFKKEGENQYMAYKKLVETKQVRWYKNEYVETELWREELSNSTTLVEHAVAHFKKQLQTYQKIIKQLIIKSKYMCDGINFDAEITNLKNLESLSIDGNFDSSQYISKTTRSLKSLVVKKRDENNELPMEKIYKVSGLLCIPELSLNNEQFLQLSAVHIQINIGELTAEDVFNFVQSWFNGTLGREVCSIIWYLPRKLYDFYVSNDTFDLVQLFRLFGDEAITISDRLLRRTFEGPSGTCKKVVTICSKHYLHLRFCDDEDESNVD